MECYRFAVIEEITFLLCKAPEGVEKLGGWKLLRRLGIEKRGVFSCGGFAPARENTPFFYP